jgi:hypothetical protein
MKKYQGKKHFVGNRYNSETRRQYTDNTNYDIDKGLRDFSNEELSTILHPWINDLRSTALMIQSNSSLPCFTRGRDGVSVTNCEICRKMYLSRRKYQEEKEKMNVSQVKRSRS